jgi:hypothetical protein
MSIDVGAVQTQGPVLGRTEAQIELAAVVHRGARVAAEEKYDIRHQGCELDVTPFHMVRGCIKAQPIIEPLRLDSNFVVAH